MPSSEADVGGKLNGHKRPMAVAIIAALLGSTSTPFVLVKLGINPFRPGAYTAAMAEARKDIVDLQIAALKDSIIEQHDTGEQQLNAILALQQEAAGAAKEREQMLRNQDRILDRMERYLDR